MKHIEKDGSGYFAAENNGSEEGRMTYIRTGDSVLIINHTHVSPGKQGQGLGSQMVKAAVDFARETGCKIKATCPFALAVLIKNPGWQDVMVR